jgi:hypothetical protein
MRFLPIVFFCLFASQSISFGQKSKLYKPKDKSNGQPTRMQGSYTKKTDWANFKGVEPMRSTYTKRTDWANFEGTPRMISAFQRNSVFRNYTNVALGAGQSNYYGDLSSYRAFSPSIVNMTRWNISGHYQRHISQRFATRINLSVIKLVGDDANLLNVDNSKYTRGLHFRNNIKEVSLQAVYSWDRRNNDGPEGRKSGLVPYFVGGIALFSHKPQAKLPTTLGTGWVNLREQKTEGQGSITSDQEYSSIGIAVPFGMGFKKRISNRFDLSIEGQFRYTLGNTGKYIDDVAKNYIPNSFKAGGSPQQQLSFRGNESILMFKEVVRNTSATSIPNPNPPVGQRGNNRQDIYFTSVIKLNYYLFKPTLNKCPVEE